MIPWIEIDTSPIPGGRETLRLMRRGTELAIWLGSIELMNSRRNASEVALAELPCRSLQGRATPTVLIGGLGMGFTLRAALRELGPAARVVVAELVPAVVAWARGPMAEIFEGSLDDPRVSVMEGDVRARIAEANGTLDAILLDVDNGPGGQTRAANEGLYGASGLAAARRALRPGGLLAVWSVEPNVPFPARMRSAGFAVEEVAVRTHARRGSRHVIWIGARA